MARAAPAEQRRSVDKRSCEDPLERERLARVFEQGSGDGRRLRAADRPRPGREHNGRGRWRSGPWFLRAEKCYLIPGDSPIGFRLPLDSLPWATPADAGFMAEPDPLAPHPDLPPLDAFRRAPVLRHQEPWLPQDAGGDGEARREAWRRALAPDLAPRPGIGSSAANVVRTAMAVEPRDGHLFVFMPPAERTEDYLDLVAARSRTRPRSSASPCSSKATRRPAATRACCTSASRPIPA